jgi:outer membrane protein
VNLNWPLFQGLLTRSQVKEAKANVSAVQAQNAALVNQVRLEVEQAHLQVRAAKATLAAVGEALINSRERLRLAEGRYQSGVGSIIELGDAQVAAATAAAQSIQAEYNVATARAALLKALGRGL